VLYKIYVHVCTGGAVGKSPRKSTVSIARLVNNIYVTRKKQPRVLSGRRLILMINRERVFYTANYFKSIRMLIKVIVK